jgi:hypothetical protein
MSQLGPCSAVTDGSARSLCNDPSRMSARTCRLNEGPEEMSLGLAFARSHNVYEDLDPWGGL